MIKDARCSCNIRSDCDRCTQNANCFWVGWVVVVAFNASCFRRAFICIHIFPWTCFHPICLWAYNKYIPVTRNGRIVFQINSFAHHIRIMHIQWFGRKTRAHARPILGFHLVPFIAFTHKSAAQCPKNILRTWQSHHICPLARALIQPRPQQNPHRTINELLPAPYNNRTQRPFGAPHLMAIGSCHIASGVRLVFCGHLIADRATTCTRARFAYIFVRAQVVKSHKLRAAALIGAQATINDVIIQATQCAQSARDSI